jgi:hypothetical protein
MNAIGCCNVDTALCEVRTNVLGTTDDLNILPFTEHLQEIEYVAVYRRSAESMTS